MFILIDKGNNHFSWIRVRESSPFFGFSSALAVTFDFVKRFDDIDAENSTFVKRFWADCGSNRAG